MEILETRQAAPLLARHFAWLHQHIGAENRLTAAAYRFIGPSNHLSDSSQLVIRF